MIDGNDPRVTAQRSANDMVRESFAHVFANDLKEICAHCGCTRGAHSGSSYYSTHYLMHVPYNYCPGTEGRMDWDKGPGTTFKRKETSNGKAV